MSVELNDRHSAPLSCTNCRQVVRVSIDRHATGNLTIECPKCGHEHYRYCEEGVITEDRWRSSAQMVSSYYYTASATSDTCTYTSAGGAFLQSSWYNSDSTTNG
jgi:predicted  nucleic acid-binding Zn-ribbon protein